MNASTVRFGDFRLDPARRELWRNGERVRLPVRVFDCIAYLIEHRDRAIGRDELIAAIWGNADVSDNVLDQTVLRARRILGDTGDERSFILTKPRFGYVWGAPTEVVETVPEDERRVGAGYRLWPWLAAVAGVLVISLFLLSMLRDGGLSSGASARTERAVVLPVTVEAGSDYAWVRLGLMDLIGERLRTAGLTVVPSDNVVALFRDREEFAPSDIEDAATVLAAGLVLTAEARTQQGRWRVTLRSVRGGDSALTTLGEAPDILAAARIATDIMARHLGLQAPPAAGPPADEAVAGLLQQVEAAMLADDVHGARALLERLDAAQRARPDVLYQYAMADFRSGRLDSAMTELEALLDRDPVKQDALFHARVLNGLSNVLLRRGDLAAAEQRVDAAVALLENGAPVRELGRALTGRAVIRSSRDRFSEALTDFARARVVLESVGDRFALARVNANIGILEVRRDRLAEGLPILSDAADTLAVFHDLSSELYARVALVYVQLALRDPAAALVVEARLRELRDSEPDGARRRYADLALVQLLLANGRLEDADRLLRPVTLDADRAGDEPISGWARAIAAGRALVEGDHDRALRLAEESLARDWEGEHPRAYARTRLIRVQALMASGRAVPARAEAVAIAEWAGERRTPVAQIYADLAQAVTAVDDETATAAFERALDQAEAGRVPDDLLRVSEFYADYLIRGGRLGRAGEVAARAADWADRDYTAALLQLRLYHALARPTAWHQALMDAQALAGEREIPYQLQVIPTSTN